MPKPRNSMYHAPLPAGNYLRPETGLGPVTPGGRGPYTVYARDQQEVDAAVKRTRTKRSRMAKRDGITKKSEDIVGGPFAGAIPYTHMVVMRALDPAWPKGDDRMMECLETGNIRVRFLVPGEIILPHGGPKDLGAFVELDPFNRIRATSVSVSMHTTGKSTKPLITEG